MNCGANDDTALSAFDIVVAQVEAAIDESLHQKVEGLKALVPDLADFGEPGEIAMQVAAVLAGKAPVRANFLTENFGKELIARWPLVEKSLRRAVDFLAEERIFAGDLLPADPLLTLLGAFCASAPDGKDGEGNARRLARRALSTGSFSERYQKTSATRTELDHRQLVALRDAGGPLPDLLDPVLTPLPEAPALRSAGWPKTRDRLGHAVLAASLRLGGHDFADEAPFSRATLNLASDFKRKPPLAHTGLLAPDTERLCEPNRKVKTFSRDIGTRNCKTLSADIIPPHLILSAADQDEFTLEDILMLRYDGDGTSDEFYRSGPHDC